MRYIDIRSDTVTLPTQKMREAMFRAEVGDDVYGDDPTVRKLEEMAAERVGKEAALFVPSGTFGNELALLTHTLRGDEVILDANSHIILHEAGASAVIAGVQLRTFRSKNGHPDPHEIESLIRSENIHFPRTGLICLENAHGMGTVIDLESMKSIYEIAKSHNIPVHLDGARIFNAACTLKVDARKIAQYADSVMFCLSKGLSAPIGSILAGTKPFIEKARKGRKLMGGGMRQAGIIAAAGIVAIEEMIDRLCEDHENAKILAKGLEKIKHIEVFKDRLDINMVFFKARANGDDFVSYMMNRGIKINPEEDGEYRFVTNKDVTRDDIYYVLESVEKYFQKLA
ncbi:MAG: low-specificity L-threonine aldolase [Mesoaciditoga sp.]|uniref:low-specificity L-threonine aldolase n=1 Tax=Athalassotoga sp. TaxID=2022597 RepID=UPI000CC70B36|nr:MAG: low-specificity L-threonine aldolase [Mesoaciditoga sp.]PMP79608.1 MAG: low-specificity L-threonine aldolase [Mesoaciditoga sp.]HEU25152.1 low-specificity L-threonine aldolase [Mesoaciditoga lauensis]